MLDQNIRNQAEQFVRDIRETDVYKILYDAACTAEEEPGAL